MRFRENPKNVFGALCNLPVPNSLISDFARRDDPCVPPPSRPCTNEQREAFECFAHLLQS
jgi:hypothetical protein